MFSAHRAKTGALIAGGIVLFVVLGLVLIRNQQTKADNALGAPPLPPTALPSQLSGEPVLGVFEGTTPCSPVQRPLPHIPDGADCEMMTWKLTLLQDPATGNPTSFQLASAYGMTQPGTPGLQGGGTEVNLEGTWRRSQGTGGTPGAEIYQLHPDSTQAAVRFAKIDDNLLHLLGPDMGLMVGNASWSYTLNRTDRRIVGSPAADPANDRASESLPPAIASLSPDPGVFEGRVPCIDVLLALHGISAPGCQRVKVQLTLHQDPETGTPTTFELASVYVGAGNDRYSADGTWTILRGSQSEPEAIVSQLTPTGDQRPMFFLKADDNHLFLLDADFSLMVGDALMSYTLSRQPLS